MLSTSSIGVTVDDGEFGCYVAWPQGPGPHPVIIVLQEIFGVNEGIRSIAEGYAAKGYIAVAPDLFWRTVPALELSEASEDDWARAFALYQAFDLDKGVRDIGAVAAAARTLPGANGKVGVTGYCLGGLLTYLSAARIDADAFAAYYGGATDKYLDEAGAIRAPLLYHLAGADEYIGPAAQAAIRLALEARPGRELHLYAGRDHAFARPGGHHYHAADANLANARTHAFFARHLAMERNA
jgi:carboxymethylenebutenolidase